MTIKTTPRVPLATEEARSLPPAPKAEPVDQGKDLLTDLVDVLGRFVVLDNTAKTAVALWVLHAHAHEAADISPILLLTSPMKGCGKSTLLDLLERLVPRPIMSANASPAALFRSTKDRPTLLLDEVDLLTDRQRGNADFISFLNGGHRRGTGALRCEGDDNQPTKFESWCPKALAHIGLPSHYPTLIDRALLVTLRRKRASEQVERFRKSSPYPGLETLKTRAVCWAEGHLAQLRAARPHLPEALTNRLGDNWEPLLAIADAAGADWAERAREAALALASKLPEEDHETLLLHDLRDLFAERKELTTEELLQGLRGLEERPWERGENGRPVGGQWLAKRLRPFGIHSVKLIRGGRQKRGFRRGQFESAWADYLEDLDGSKGSFADLERES